MLCPKLYLSVLVTSPNKVFNKELDFAEDSSSIVHGHGFSLHHEDMARLISNQVKNVKQINYQGKKQNNNNFAAIFEIS